MLFKYKVAWRQKLGSASYCIPKSFFWEIEKTVPHPIFSLVKTVTYRQVIAHANGFLLTLLPIYYNMGLILNRFVFLWNFTVFVLNSLNKTNIDIKCYKITT